MSNAVLETTAKILAHRPMGRNQTTGTNEIKAGDEGRDQHEKTYRNHRRKASGFDHQSSQDFSRRVVRSLRHEGANGNRGKRVTYRPGDPADDLSRAEMGQLHFTESQDGLLLICLKSLG